MGGEGHGHLGPGGKGQLLLDLGGVPVAPHLVGGDVLVGLDEQVAVDQRAAGARQPRLGVDHDPFGGGQPGGDQRGQREQGGGRVAAGHGHPAGPAQLVPVQLGQAVGPAAELLRERMLGAVPDGIGARVAQPEVGRQVDDQAGGGQRPGGDLRRPAVRQGQEQHVGALFQTLIDRAEDELAVGGPEPRIAGDQRLAGRLVPGGPGDLEPRMAGQQSQQLGAGVAGGAENAGSTGGHQNSYA